MRRVDGCAAGIIELRNALKREIEDEATASSRYMEAAAKLRHFGFDPLADKLKFMAFDEFTHKAVLTAVIDIITQECGE